MRQPYSYGESKPVAGDFVLRFGKHKGKKLRDVHDVKTLQHYLSWSELREDARDAIKRWLRVLAVSDILQSSREQKQ